MNIFNKPTSFLIIIATVLLLFSCKQPETVVVTENPTPISPQPQVQDSAVRDASFRQLNIGENDRVPTLNPLFAENTSTMRTLQLVFEGLVRYDGDESIIPAVAKRWNVSSDSTTYRFTLRDSVFYHDSDAFSTGIGRKVVAGDVKYVFEHMAQNNVPGHAARLFMNIRGFEPYYREQHNVLYPAERQLSEVRGITVPNDSTIVFKLEDKDPHFLEKLASPYAVIYPREAVDPGNAAAFKPVGTGPFVLSQKRGADHFIFARNNNYYLEGKPVLNRVDVRIFNDGNVLAEALRREEIHLVPQPGPEVLKSVLGTNGGNNNAQDGRFQLNYTRGRTFYALSYNPQSTLSPATARNIVAYTDTASVFQGIPGKIVSFSRLAKESDTSNIAGGSTINTTFTSDPYVKTLLRSLVDSLKQTGVTLNMLKIRTPVKNTGLYAQSVVPFFPTDTLNADTHSLIRFSVLQTPLQLSSIKNLTFNRYPWWINLRNTTLPGIDNLGR